MVLSDIPHLLKMVPEFLRYILSIVHRPRIMTARKDLISRYKKYAVRLRGVE